MKKDIWTQEYEINTFLINMQKRLDLYSLLNLLQDIAWSHATHLGHGYENMIEKNLIWALTRQKIYMQSWPKWGEKVKINTWVRPPEGIFATREFEILVQDHKIGECTTSWLTLNAETRKPMRSISLLNDFEFRKEGHLRLETSKIELNGHLEPVSQFQVRNSDLDMNEHVNNTRYAQWILDSVPLEWLHEIDFHQYEINFLAETKAGDVITVQRGQLKASPDLILQFQGIRQSDQKPVFSACLSQRLKSHPQFYL